MSKTSAVLRLARLDSSLLVFLSVLVPLLAKTGSVVESLRKAVPVFFICMCAFIVNDLDDIESDKINHPERPLPSGQIYPSVAVGIYFFCLTLALLTTHAYAASNTTFLYFILLMLVINYSYVVEYFPSLKTLYVAITSTIPIMVVIRLYPDAWKFYPIVISVFFLVLSRELCMDYADRAGDKESFVHKARPRILAAIVISAQAAGILLLFLLVEALMDLIVLALIGCTSLLSAYVWCKLEKLKLAIFILKLQLFIGLYYLI